MPLSERGIVLRAHSSLYSVMAGEETIECRARRRLQRETDDWPEFPVPGDEVQWTPLSSGGKPRQGLIEAVHPRRSEVSRTRFGAKHVVVANLDLLVVVIAVRDPGLDRGLLDRLLAIAERNRLPAVVCFNKIDLIDLSELDPVRAIYERAGYSVVCTAAKAGVGIEPLRELLRGRICALMGPSGAGKSRLVRALEPGLEIRTGDVSEKTGQGRHTTTRVDLHRTHFGALLADTPGVRDFSLWHLAPEELRELFPELRAKQDGCRFGGCLHVVEPDCAVKAAVDQGLIDPTRYRSYQAILDGLAEERAGVDREGRSRKERSQERGGTDRDGAPRKSSAQRPRGDDRGRGGGRGRGRGNKERFES